MYYVLQNNDMWFVLHWTMVHKKKDFFVCTEDEACGLFLQVHETNVPVTDERIQLLNDIYDALKNIQTGFSLDRTRKTDVFCTKRRRRRK